MKGNSLNEISLKHLFKKDNTLFIIIITILILIIYVLLTITNVVIEYYYNTNKYNFLARTLIVEKEDKTEKELDSISNINHVVVNVSDKYYNSFYTNIYEKEHSSLAINSIINQDDLKIVKGRSPKNINEIVIPIKFCPYDVFHIKKENFMDGNDLIGKTFTVKSDKSVTYDMNHDDPKYEEMMDNREKVTLTVVGTYDSTINLVESNVAYTSTQTIDGLKSQYNGGQGFTDSNGNSTFYNNEYVDRMIRVDSYKNLEYVKNELTKQNFSFNEVLSINLLEFLTILLVPLVVSIILLVVAFNLIKNFIKKKLNNRHTNLGILKAIGYTNKQIKKIEFTENIFITIFCIVFAFIIYSAIYLIVTKNFLTMLDYYSCPVNMPLLLIGILILLLMIFIKIINNKVISKILKKNVMELIKED